MYFLRFCLNINGMKSCVHCQAKVLAAMLQLAEAKATQELHCRDGTLPANCCTIIAWCLGVRLGTTISCGDTGKDQDFEWIFLSEVAQWNPMG